MEETGLLLASPELLFIALVAAAVRLTQERTELAV
jgi:hypothetical protein